MNAKNYFSFNRRDISLSTICNLIAQSYFCLLRTMRERKKKYLAFTLCKVSRQEGPACIPYIHTYRYPNLKTSRTFFLKKKFDRSLKNQSLLTPTSLPIL